MEKSNKRKAGFTITEAMVASLLVFMGVSLIYTGVLGHIRTLRTSALLQEAQDIAFSELWNRYSMPLENLVEGDFPTPESCRMGTNGVVRISVVPGSLGPEHKLIVCQVWAPPLVGYSSPHGSGSRMVVEYEIERFESGN